MTHLKLFPVGLFLCAFLSACGTTDQGVQSLHDPAHQAQPPFVDVAVNLRANFNDVSRLYDFLAASGVRCGIRAISLNAEQVVVERDDFARGKTIVEGIIVRAKLSIRVFKEARADDARVVPRMEVWENGQFVREEDYMFYDSNGAPLPGGIIDRKH